MASGGAAALQRLRAAMRDAKYVSEPLTAYIIPTDDAHQNEYIANCDKRREFITGFTGSAGIALVTMKGAWLWTDGRYFLQASQQLDPDHWTLMKQGIVPGIEDWISKELESGSRIGFDPSLISYKLYKRYYNALECSGQVLVPVSANLVDLVWDSRPPHPCNSIMILPLKFSGRSWKEKVGDIRKKMALQSATALVITSLDEIAWLFNLRGSDIEYNPLFFSYAIIDLEKIRLYIDSDRVTDEMKEHLCVGGEGGVVICEYGAIWDDVKALVKETEGKIWVNSDSSYGLVSLVPRARWIGKLSPLQLLKAVKNETEIRGMKEAHIRDGAAVCEYFCWLEERIKESDPITEISAADKLETLRMEQPDFVSLSFPTISSSGPHGAIIHYKPTPSTDRPLSTSELYLCDSGAQFLDGTTDITRTIHFGTPTPKEKEAFTRVLMGQINLCSLMFPNKTHGHRIEALARAPLWAAGLDYRHGTGHGVGSFLCVHEGPQSVGSRPSAEPLEAGMFISDEPGYYEDGEFGIRLENIVEIVPTTTKYNFGSTGYLTMEPVTMVPIQTKMIEPSLLNEAQIEWLNTYHASVREKVGAYLRDNGKEATYQWLLRETAPLG